jgi:FixJ family two-component response regulator
MSVLIVDDDETILIALRLLLKNEGMSCVACRSPQEALAAVKREACQLALVDLNYVHDTTSGKEGLALISALRELDEDLPIVAMTGWGTIGIAVEAMQRGAADFVEKPWDDNNRLLSIIRTQMKLRSAQHRARALSAENALLREQSEDTDMVCDIRDDRCALRGADPLRADQPARLQQYDQRPAGERVHAGTRGVRRIGQHHRPGRHVRSLLHGSGFQGAHVDDTADRGAASL